MSRYQDVAISLLKDVWQDGRFDLLPRLVHDDVQRHHPRFPARCPEDLKEMILVYRTAFPDMQYWFLHFAEEGENLALVYEVSGTHSGPFNRIPATGITDRMTCLDFFRFREGRIAEMWTMFDELGMLMKMGVVRL